MREMNTLRFAPAMLAAILLGPLAACAGAAAAGGEPVGPPVADPGALEASLRAATLPASPRQANFGWSLNEGGSVVRGRGVIRYVAPERLRLDLFGPRGETYLAAALVGEEFRVPPAVAGEFKLPSPSLLWAALGVATPPPGSLLESASAGVEGSLLRYRLTGAETLELRTTGGDAPRLVRAERIGPSGVLESVYIDYSSAGSIAKTRYRDWAAFRELVLEPESFKDVASFPESIWSPGAPAR